MRAWWGRVFRLLSALSGMATADGPTDLLAAARHAVLCSLAYHDIRI